MASTKRAYKLQEFIAHTSNVNCLKIGRKTSRLLATGGEDHMVNLWNIGQPNAVLSLSGHTSAVETVNFDSAEVLVAAGATSGTIKLWDLEEAKIIRTLTGHRSSCTTVDFHPFGEFFASGSLDTNLKIWDIRRKGCIQTYKGHTRRVNAIRFTPDGRWVVSGGEDNTVKLWDLTAGKLLHNFKCHEGQIQCIDFHPNEFLLATGSTDRTVKFWDLESFEMIGSAGPETTGVRSMIFNPDGRTLLCGLHESLKVFSWEPIRCHDTADVGWSGLSDMNIHEGKLLGCSYNRNCVGIWVVDISWAEPYEKSNTHIEPKSNFSGNLPLQGENNISTSIRRLSVSHTTDPGSDEVITCEIRVPKNYPPTEIQKEGRSDASVSDWEKREPSPSFVNSKSNYCFDNSRSAEASYSFTSRDKLGAQSDTEGPLSIVKDTLNAGNEDAIVVISKQQHEEFLISTKSRLKKLQVVDSLLQRNDIKDVLNAIETMSDHIVSADVVSVLLNRMNIITLEVCTFLLPVLSFLLEGKMDRSISISLDMLRNIVYLFGPIIRSTLSANLPIGVDLEAEKRTEWCNKCFIELEKTRTKLSSLTRRGGLVSKSAEELKHALRETF